MKLILFAIILFLNTTLCTAETLFVYPGSSISARLEEASPFDTLVITSGTYYENNIVLKKPVYIIGERYPVLDACGKGDIIVISSDCVHVEGLRFINVGTSFLNELSAIRVNRVSNVIIRNNLITNCFFGIYLQYAADCSLVGNVIRGNIVDEATAGNAIHVWKGDRIHLQNNRVEGHRDGIYFEFVNNSKIENNISKGNLRYGLHFMFSNDDLYCGNVFENNGAGVAVMFSKRIKMLKNIFQHNWGGSAYGILLKEISHGEIGGNSFDDNTVGIYSEGATALMISGNEFSFNGKAIDMKGNSFDNKIMDNNFYGNTFDVFTNTTTNNNFYDHNYWSSYQGYDLDRDGIGDVPFRPVSIMSMITDKIPSATILLHSFFSDLMELLEKEFPEFTPETLADNHPSMLPVVHD